jgi:hypothetical protein
MCLSISKHSNKNSVLFDESEGVNIGTEAICSATGFCEHANEHSLSILWWNFVTICVNKSFIRRSWIKIYFTFPRTFTKFLNYSPVLCLVCLCNIFFRELYLLLMAGEAGFGPERDVTSIVVVRVTVPLVTAVTNWSAMVPVANLQPPWLR